MDLREMTSPCGMDCFNCPAQERNITEDIRQKLSKATGKAPEDVSCRGCRALGGKNLPTIKACPTYDCLEKRGLEFCSECAEFPCDKYNPCKDKADKLPHNLKVFNLCKIQRIGIDKWAQEAKGIRAKYFMGDMVPGLGPVIPKED